MDLTGIGSIADFASGIMDRFWPKQMTEEERAKAQVGLIESMEQREVVRDSLRAEVIKAEMSQGDDYTKRARPTIVYAGLTFIALVHVIFPIVAWFTKEQLPALALPSDFWMVWGGVCSVWMIGRSAERVMGGDSKIISAITGGKR
ncbi:MAG: holin family protein [Proteobacteria bacterium]|nr:holin family protein [Pseudomonadota bacterium]